MCSIQTSCADGGVIRDVENKDHAVIPKLQQISGGAGALALYPLGDGIELGECGDNAAGAGSIYRRRKGGPLASDVVAKT